MKQLIKSVSIDSDCFLVNLGRSVGKPHCGSHLQVGLEVMSMNSVSFGSDDI